MKEPGDVWMQAELEDYPLVLSPAEYSPPPFSATSSAIPLMPSSSRRASRSLGRPKKQVASGVLSSKLIETINQSGRTILTEIESRQLLAAYGIPIVETRVATSETEAVTCAEDIGYPVVLKLFSDTITHKTDVGGVQVHLSGADAVRSAYHTIEAAVRAKARPKHFLGVTVQPMIPLNGYKLILGSSIDQQFAPVLLFDSGGQLVEVYRDRALALPPLTTTLAWRMMEQTRVFTALQGVRGRPPIDLATLEQLLVRFSYLVVEPRQIKEIEMNPLLASPGRLLALDARVVLHRPDISEDELPKLAIRPYPL